MSENQRQKKWIAVLFAVCAVTATVWYLVGRPDNVPSIAPDEAPTQSTQLRTEARAKQIAKTLIDQNFEITTFVQNDQKRGLASEADGVEAVKHKVSQGQYGRDAWGHPFEFQVTGSKVIVWSMGENHQLDSSADQLAAVKAAGDDIVISVQF